MTNDPARFKNLEWSCGPTASQLCFREQLCDRHFHRIGDAQDRRNARILTPALYAAHVRPIDCTSMGQLFLRKPSLQPRSPDRSSQRDKRWVLSVSRRRGWHAGIVAI